VLVDAPSLACRFCGAINAVPGTDREEQYSNERDTQRRKSADLRIRIFGLILFLISVGLMIYGYQLAINHEYYSVKAGFMAPLGVLAGLAFLVFGRKVKPTPEDRKRQLTPWRAILLLVFILGVFAVGFTNLGLLNYFAAR
jgi:hypothetical protein